jgi:oligogalacturonide lyase
VRNGITRRTLLALLPAALPAQLKKRTQPLTAVGEFVAFPDPVTEARVVRLTSPANSSWLPAPQNRFISVKGRFLICSSDRNGSAAPFQLDLHAGLAHPLGETTALSPQSLWLDDGQRTLYLLDGGELKEIRLANRRMRTIAEGVDAFAPAAGDFMVVRRGVLQLLNAGTAIAHAGTAIANDVAPFCLMRPGGSGCLFMREDSPDAREYWLGGQDKPVLLAKGRVSSPFWSPGGKSLLFLRDVEGPNGVFAEIHEVAVDGGVERCVAPTSQFAAFAPNGDASVFVGASRSKAQPTVILLLRSVKRELTLCEHRASHPAGVSPIFSPDSRRVYFESDHEGKQALYSVNVEQLVEPTATA